MVSALKNVNIWLVSFNIFFVYSVYCGLTYFIPFLEEAYALPAALVGVYGIINQYGLKMLGGPGSLCIPASRVHGNFHGVPREITGSAMSMGSFIGYLPGAFMYAIYGGILDRYEGLAGYRIVFIIMACFAVGGFLLSCFIVNRIKKQKG